MVTKVTRGTAVAATLAATWTRAEAQYFASGAPHLRSEEDGRPDRPQGRLRRDQEEPEAELAQIPEDVALPPSVDELLSVRQAVQADDPEADPSADERNANQRRKLELLPPHVLLHRDSRHPYSPPWGIAPSALAVNAFVQA
jgi:hypothetical protein